MDELMRIVVLYKYLLIALVTAFIGAMARIGYERDDKIVARKTSFKYISGALFVGSMLYTLFENLQYQKWIGLACLIGGLVSVDIIKILIDQLPEVVWSEVKKRFFGKTSNLKENDHDL